MTPAGHHCRSTGCLSSRSYSGPEQHRASTTSLAVQGSPGTLEAAVNHLCSYSIDKLLGPCRAQGSWTNSMPQILASHCLTTEPWQGTSTVTEPQFPHHTHIPGRSVDRESPAGLRLIDITFIKGRAKKGGAQASAEAPARTLHFLSISLEDGTQKNRHKAAGPWGWQKP